MDPSGFPLPVSEQWPIPDCVKVRALIPPYEGNLLTSSKATFTASQSSTHSVSRRSALRTRWQSLCRLPSAIQTGSAEPVVKWTKTIRCHSFNMLCLPGLCLGRKRSWQQTSRVSALRMLDGRGSAPCSCDPNRAFLDLGSIAAIQRQRTAAALPCSTHALGVAHSP